MRKTETAERNNNGKVKENEKDARDDIHDVCFVDQCILNIPFNSSFFKETRSKKKRIYSFGFLRRFH